MTFDVAYAGYQNQQEGLRFVQLSVKQDQMSTTSAVFAIKTNYPKAKKKEREKTLISPRKKMLYESENAKAKMC